MKKVFKNKKILILIILFIVLYCIFGYKKLEYIEDYIPGRTYYVRQSRITGISYCKVIHGCSYVDCKPTYSYEIHLRSFFESRNMI